MVTSVSVKTSIPKLRASLHGQLILPGDAAYESAHRIWNGAIDRHPELIVCCADVNDVQRAVEY